VSTLRRRRAEPADYPPEQPAAALRWIRHSESIEMRADATPLVAIGILMTHRLITRDQAFHLHGTASQHSAASYATWPKRSSQPETSP
jgi:hypothetical protein